MPPAAHEPLDIAPEPLRLAIAAPLPQDGPIRAWLESHRDLLRTAWACDADALARASPEQCDAILLPIEADGALIADAALIRECVARAQVPLIAIGEHVPIGLARAAVEAGAADCLSLAADSREQLALAVARAAAQRARLALERSRADDLESALHRAQETCARERAAAMTDWTTDLYNKRYLEERLAEEENIASRTGRPVALVLADLDHFKDVNDAFGHEVGDRVLRETAQVIRESLRDYDSPCRYGGEEFGLILPATTGERAAAVAERIRAALATHRFANAPGQLRITASFGVADLPAPGVTTRQELLRAADRALYRAKTEGRDRTCLAESGLLATPLARAPAADLGQLERLRASIHDFTASEADRYFARLRAVVSRESAAFVDQAERTAGYAEQIAAALGLAPESVQRIRRASLFQDLGMVALLPSVAHEGALDELERELVRQHPALSVRILDAAQFLREELPLILHHHERWDGGGYPRGLRGERIPLGARVLSVAMAYEALGRDRPYRAALAPEAARREIEGLAGTWYDPCVVRAFSAAVGAANGR